METGRHIDADDLDRYSLGTMSDAEAAPIEEHLMICEECRARVAENDEYVAAMKNATALLPPDEVVVPRPAAAVVRPRRTYLTWALAFASIGGAFILFRSLEFGNSSAPVPVALYAMRGSLPGAEAKAGERLALTPDVTGLAAYLSYRLEVVDAGGRQVANAEWKQSPVTTPRLSAGTYFVRIYSPGNELLREYGLVVKR